MRSLRLTLKIAIPLAIMVALILLMAVATLFTISIDHDVTKEIRGTVEKQRVLSSVESDYIKLLMAENGYALSGNPKYIETFKVEKQAIQSSLDTLNGAQLTAAERDELDALQAGLDLLSREMEILFTEKYGEAENHIQETVEQLDNSIAGSLADEISKLSNSIEDEVERSLQTMEQADRREFWFTIIPVIVVLPIAVAVVLITIYRISKPLLMLVQMAEKITMRDFSTRVTAGPMDEIGMLTKAFNAMAEEIERRYTELESFAYIVAHDLKNPVAGIYGLSEYVLEYAGDRISEEEREALQSIHGAAESMNTLITDLLEFARAGKVEFAKEPVSMRLMLEDITKELKFTIKERHANVYIPEELPAIYCDPIRFSQVWKNLIYNALKYNDKEAPTVGISARDTDDGMLEFQVVDNGIGIEERFFESIFLPFQRAPTDGHFEGTGIGLAIVKRVVDFHGGSIWVSSIKGQGTTFHFKMPKIHSENGVLKREMAFVAKA